MNNCQILDKLYVFGTHLHTDPLYIPEYIEDEVQINFDFWKRNKDLALATSQPHKNKYYAITEAAENFVFKLEEIMIDCRSEDPMFLAHVVLKFMNVQWKIVTDISTGKITDNPYYAYMNIQGKICYFSTPTNSQSSDLARVEVARQFIRDVMFLVHPHRLYRAAGLNLTEPVRKEIKDLINGGSPVIFTMRYCYHCKAATHRYMNEPNLKVVELDMREDRHIMQQVLDQMGLLVPSLYINGVLQQ